MSFTLYKRKESLFNHLTMEQWCASLRNSPFIFKIKSVLTSLWRSMTSFIVAQRDLGIHRRHKTTILLLKMCYLLFTHNKSGRGYATYHSLDRQMHRSTQISRPPESLRHCAGLFAVSQCGITVHYISFTLFFFIIIIIHREDSIRPCESSAWKRWLHEICRVMLLVDWVEVKRKSRFGKLYRYVPNVYRKTNHGKVETQHCFSRLLFFSLSLFLFF
jgi:hypothetical protein